MPPFWPFKRSKSGEDEGPRTVEYDRDENTAETLADRSHVEDEGYQAAMNLLENPHLGAPEICRASWRERVSITVVAGYINRTDNAVGSILEQTHTSSGRTAVKELSEHRSFKSTGFGRRLRTGLNDGRMIREKAREAKKR